MKYTIFSIPIWSLLPVLAVASNGHQSGRRVADDQLQAQQEVKQALVLEQNNDSDGARKLLREAIAADPDLVPAHQEYIRLASSMLYQESPEERSKDRDKLIAEYTELTRRFPTSSGVWFGLGSIYSAAEDPRAKPFLDKAVSLNPKLAEAYYMLAGDAERWGDLSASATYVEKAYDANPSDLDYLKEVAFCKRQQGLMHGAVDTEAFTAQMLEIEKKEHGTREGALDLLEIMLDGEPKQFDAMAERLMSEYPADKFYDTYRTVYLFIFGPTLISSPEKALELANSMKPLTFDKSSMIGLGVTPNMWSQKCALAQAVIKAREFIGEGKGKEALDQLSAVKLARNEPLEVRQFFALLKADAELAMSDFNGAYQDLLQRYAELPTDAYRGKLVSIGSNLGKTPSQVDEDIWSVVETNAKPAPDFSLFAYLQNKNLSLADLRGKPVLLTYFFPGCGPCRGEFPYFESTLRKLNLKDIAYIAINSNTDQDPYVKPFVAHYGVSFNPLRSTPQVLKDYHVPGEPTNFVLDRSGRIVYQNFRADGGLGGRALELMLAMVEAHG